MKILLHEWNNYFVDVIHHLCVENGIEYDAFTRKFEQDEVSEEFLDWFDTNVSAEKYDFVLSVNFWPMVSAGCKKKGLKYVAWCYDCPLNLTNPEEYMSYENNYIFLFDFNQYLEYKCKGIDTVYHMLLGANNYLVDRGSYTSESEKRFQAEISFVGSLYESQFPLITSLLNDSTKKVISDIITNQEELYNYNLVKECVTDELIDYMNQQYKERLSGRGDRFEVNAKAMNFALLSEVTRRNRITLLNLFGNHFDTRLYSFHTFDLLKNVKQCGTVDYCKEMPAVFHFSKINLNPVLRAIETGIPLRAFDIMGYGGFLLSSYQQELAEYYEDGTDLVLYDSYEDAYEKAEYYLKHEEERARIALNGQRKTMENYTLQIAFEKILKIVGV